MRQQLQRLVHPDFIFTGVDFSDVWNDIHVKIVDKMLNRCFNCGSHAKMLFIGLHDHVNIGIGKKPMHPEIYEKFVTEIISVHKGYGNRYRGFK